MLFELHIRLENRKSQVNSIVKAQNEYVPFYIFIIPSAMKSSFAMDGNINVSEP